MIISFSVSLIIRALGQKKLPLFREMWVTRKIFTRAAANLFFNRFAIDILFSSLVSFSFFDLWFFCLFV